MAGLPPEAVSRLAAIPMTARQIKPERRTAGRVHRDSWVDLPALALRDSGVGLERRLVFSAGHIRLELVAQRTRGGWEFVARVFENDTAVTEYVLRAGRQTLAPAADGYYFWRAEHAPRTIRLLSPQVQVDFEKVSWHPKKNK